MFKIRIFILFLLLFLSLNLNAQNFRSISNLIEQEQYSKAKNLIDQKLINSATNQELLFLKAQIESKLDNVSHAINTYYLIIKLYPLFPDAYNNLAGIFAKQGKLELAKETLEKGINTNKSYALLHKNINSIYLEMARESYVKALQLGVKKHAIDLSMAKYKNGTKVSSISNDPIVKKEKTNTLVSNTEIVIKKRALGPKKTVRRITKREVVVKAWNEPVISIKDEVITALQGWAAAWSAQDVDLYLSFYDKRFIPENGTDRQIWANQRQVRLLKPRWIEVRLSNFLFQLQSKNQAEVQVTQNYRSNSFRDKSKKRFLLTRSDDGWQILNEINYQQ
jgi:hypothetical protein